jgi:hypothetical protein
MRTFAVLVLMGFASAASAQQGEKPVDSNSVRISITGCVNNRMLVAVDPLETQPEPVSAKVAAGRAFRLSGSKDIMAELKKRNKSVVTVTGLLRKSALSPSTQGMPVAGGRVRIGGMPMNQDPTKVDPRRDPLYNVDMFDVESVRPADGVCPK